MRVLKAIVSPPGHRRGPLLIGLGLATVVGAGTLTALALNVDDSDDRPAQRTAAPAGSVLPLPTPTDLAPTTPAITATPISEKTKATRATSQPETSTVTEKAKAEPSQTATSAKVKKQKAGPVITGPFLVRNEGTGMCLDLPFYEGAEPGTQVQLWECHSPALNGEDDNHEYEKLQFGSEFLLRNVRAKQCLDVYGNEGANPGEAVLTYQCVVGDADNLMFRKKSVSGGMQIIHAKSDLCLDVAPDNPGNGQMTQLSTCSSTPNQIWTLL
ncbi:RICIN domain-containing protein [Kineosporia babensis]|uniref:Ricin-type beta-trefoil lectin domain protein n=1 Tax=Kineosporia babensis TaxID=499548 RepID=A0A9X1SS63_9ACTN|nr:RICIN domain-containing protein [Kineosporia babensis]MCD5310269.1 ricin-type beta-trefoil lectin domain protein [Kineosporia babensis]